MGHLQLHNTTLHNNYTTTTQHYTTLHYTSLHNTTLHNTTQHNTTQHNTTQHYTTLHNTTHKIKQTHHTFSIPTQHTLKKIVKATPHQRILNQRSTKNNTPQKTKPALHKQHYIT